MDYMLEPEQSAREVYIDKFIDEKLADQEYLFSQSWIEECLDQEKLVEYLVQQAEEEYDEMIFERDISNWELKQEYEESLYE